MREIIAILRGIKPNEVLAVTECLLECGIQKIEVPLNSPSPIESIGLMVKHFSDDASIGAGTVLNVDAVQQVADVGGQLIISPNCNTDVIKQTKELGLQSFPGVMTPSECFAALDAGADGLKFFPAFKVGLEGLKAYSAVIPSDVKTYAVGGVDADGFADWLDAGITGFGIGSSLYKANDSVEDVRKSAIKLVEAWDLAVSK